MGRRRSPLEQAMTIRDAWKALRAPAQKRVGSISEYIGPTVTMSDRARTKFTINQSARSQMARLRGLPAILTRMNAKACAAQRLRLYKAGPAEVPGTRSRKGVARPITRKRREMLESGACGVKAAEWAAIGGDVEEITDSPVLDFLNRPNRLHKGGAASYDMLMYAHLWMAGEAFELWIEGKYPEGVLLSPAFTMPMPSATGDELIASYAYGRERSAITEYDADDVNHYIFDPHPTNPYHGWGPMQDILAELEIEGANIDFDLAFIEGGQRPDYFGTLAENANLNPDQIKDLERHIETKTRGMSGKMKVLLAKGVTWTFPNWTSKDLQSLEKYRETCDRIRQAFGVTEDMLKLNDANLASSTNGYTKQYLSATVRPTCNNVAAQRTEMLMPRFGLEPGTYFLAYDEPVPSDSEAEERRMIALVAGGLITIDEGREELGHEAVGGEAAVLRINGTPLDAFGQPAAGPSYGISPTINIPTQFLSLPEAPHAKALPPSDPPRVAPPEGDNVEGGVEAPESGGALGGNKGVAGTPVIDSDRGVEHGTNRDHAGDARDQSGGGHRLPGADGESAGGRGGSPVPKIRAAHGDPTCGDPWGGAGCSCCRDAKRVDIEDPAVESDIAELRRTIDDFLADARAEAVRQAGASGVLDLTAYRDQLAKLLSPNLERFFSMGIALADAEAPNLAASLELKPQAAIEYAQDYAYDLVTQITDTEVQILQAKISDGLDQGASINDIAEALEADPAFQGRGEVIARTEAQRATQTAKLARYGEMGVQTRRSVTAPGASGAHVAIAAKSKAGIPLDEPIVKAGETYGAGDQAETFTRDIFAPPYRPNCRCSIEAIIPELEGGNDAG